MSGAESTNTESANTEPIGHSGEIEIDPSDYRKVLGHFPTGVTVVAGSDAEGAPGGLAIGSFFSISLDPPLVGFAVGRGSGSWGAIKDSGHFVVNVLSDQQVDVCGRFASKDPDKFAGVEWTESTHTGSPRIENSLAHIHCRTEHVLDGGDHEIVVGRVVGLEVSTDAEAKPLLFFKGAYGRLEGLS